MIEEIHECVVCRGRFSDEELLRHHVCPAAQEGTIELSGDTLPLDDRRDAPPPNPHPSVEEVKPRFRFGIDPQEAAETLLRLGNGMSQSVLLQSCTEMTVSSTEDWEIKMLNVLYAEKR